VERRTFATTASREQWEDQEASIFNTTQQAAGHYVTHYTQVRRGTRKSMNARTRWGDVSIETKKKGKKTHASSQRKKKHILVEGNRAEQLKAGSIGTERLRATKKEKGAGFVAGAGRAKTQELTVENHGTGIRGVRVETSAEKRARRKRSGGVNACQVSENEKKNALEKHV